MRRAAIPFLASPVPVRAVGRSPDAQSWRFIVPFAIFVALLGLAGLFGLTPGIAYPARVLASAAALALWSRSLLAWRPRRPLASVLVGFGVFLLWIAPELIWPPYRRLWLFRNPLAAVDGGSPSPALRADTLFVFFRIAGSTLLVPVIEELFWRAWLMRWLIAKDFSRLLLGAYGARAFWITALLFASEHGPYWDVGLAAGVAYNWWMMRTRSLADCILAHAVTNGCLAAYVLAAGAWQYWL